jgi:transposase-like protein
MKTAALVPSSVESLISHRKNNKRNKMILGQTEMPTEIEHKQCKYCGSDRVRKYGHYKGIQRFFCNDCRRKFTDKRTLAKMKPSASIVGSTTSMFYKGMSLDTIKQQLREHNGIYPSNLTIYAWIKRYSEQVVNKFNNPKRPFVGDVWLADETLCKINGNSIWLWDIIDIKTRFLLVSRTYLVPTNHDASVLLSDATQIAGKLPLVIFTNQLVSFFNGPELPFRTDGKRIIFMIPASEPAKHLIEHFHNSLKDRIEAIKGLKSCESANVFLVCWLMNYNFFRHQEELGGITPAMKAGFKFNYNNWLDILKEPNPS